MRFEFYLLLLALVAAWIGHAYLWTSILNYVYARPYPKKLLRVWRAITGLCIFGFPLFLASAINPEWFNFIDGSPVFLNGAWGRAVVGYGVFCVAIGALHYPAIDRKSTRLN